MERILVTTSAERMHSLEDIISQLSNDILIHIQSYLTLKEAATTSVLSKRWKDVWKYITKLDFDASVVLDKVPDGTEYVYRIECSKYVKRVDQVLKSHRACKLHELKVCFDIWKTYQKTISKWIRYAFARSVQRLELDMLGEGEKTKAEHLRFSKYSCTFPDPLSVCTETSSVESYSTYCGFRSLKDLCLKGVNVSGQVLEYFFRNCPLLERLVVHASGTLVNVEVTGPSLKLTHLEICHCFKSKFIKVSNTNLVSLVVKAAGKLQLHNVPMLVEISVSEGDKPIKENVEDVFSQLSCCLSQLEVLMLEITDYQIEKMEYLEFPELSKLKQLVLVTGSWLDNSLIGITSLMKACPIMQKFVLKFSKRPFTSSESFKKAIGSPLFHLKFVEWSGYYGLPCERELLTYILKNATALEKIVIDCSDKWTDCVPMTCDEVNELRDARRHAKEQLRVITQHVELLFL